MCLVTNENEGGESKARSKMNKKRFERQRSSESDHEQFDSDQSDLIQKISAIQIASNARGKGQIGGFQRTRKDYYNENDEEGYDEERIRSKYHEPSPVESDLSEPLTPVKCESDMQESEEDYYTYTHRFVGPNFDPSQGCARVLHGFRYLDLQGKPPRFDSDAAGPQMQQRYSSSTDSESGILTVSPFELSSNTFQVTFTEKTIGFRTRIGISEDENLFAEVSGVDNGGPAQLAGINVGDILLSINDDLIEGDMEEEDVYELLLSASHPRTLIFRREVFWDEEPENEATIPPSKLSGAKKIASVPIFGKLSDAMVKGKARVGSALHRKRTVLHHNLICGGCGAEPIKGNLWTCSVCEKTYLCEECYRSGIHGFEDSVEFEQLKYAVVVYKLRKKCKMFTLEFLDSLYEDICKERPEKMEYMGDWLADIIGGTSPSKIKVRGLETAAIHARARQRFVSLLMPLVSNRTDIEVNIEWIPDENTVESGREAPSGRRSYSAFEKVRIWISDKKLRTESPFAQ